MKYKYLIIIALLIVQVSKSQAGLPTIPPDSLTAPFFKSIIMGDYEKAENLIQTMSQLPGTFWDNEAWTKYHQLQILISQRQDYGYNYNEVEYGKLYQEVESTFNRILEKSETGADSAAAYFVLGGLAGFDASLFDMKGKVFSAFRAGSHSVKLMQKALEIYPDLIDAKFMDAVIEYYESKYLSWTPFKKDFRDAAIDTIEMIAENGVYSRYVAIATLTWIYIEEDDCPLAAKWADHWIAETGEIRNFLEPCGKAYFLMEDWENAADRYEKLLASLQNMPERNLRRELGALNRLVTIYYSDERWEKAIDRADLALELPLDEKTVEEKKSVISNIEKLRKKSDKELAKL